MSAEFFAFPETGAPGKDRGYREKETTFFVRIRQKIPLFSAGIHKNQRQKINVIQKFCYFLKKF